MFCNKFIFICSTLCYATLVTASFAMAGFGLSKSDDSSYSVEALTTAPFREDSTAEALTKAPFYEDSTAEALTKAPLHEDSTPSHTSTKKPSRKKTKVEINYGDSASGLRGNFSVKGKTPNTHYHLDAHGKINRNNDTNHFEGGVKGSWYLFA